MDVKYIPSDWEKMKDGIGDLIGLGRWGKGMIDELKDLSDILEDAESDIAKYDVDGAITFQHSSQKSKYQGLFEDFDVLHNFSGKVGDMVDRTIDQPFYEDMDAFVAAMRDLSISNYTTTNRIGATKIVQSYAGYGVPQQFEIDKAEVSLDDLLSGDTFYGEQMKLEYEAWKELNPDQDFSQKEYQQSIVNTRAFEYESIRNTQENKEFWFQIGALVVIVGTTLICPPAGIALGAAYGAYELTSALSGKDLVSGRELETSERWVRGLLAPLDIVPGAGVAVTKFAGAGATGLARIGGKVVPTGLKAGMSEGIQKGVTSVKSLAETASHFGATRLKSAGTVIQSRTNMVINKAKEGTIEGAKLADKAITGAKNLDPRRIKVMETTLGNKVIVHDPAKNTHTFANKISDIINRNEGVNLGGTKGTGKVNLKNIDEFIDGTKTFDDVVDDFVRLYSEKIQTNKTWSWNKSFHGGEYLTARQRKLIKEKAIADGLIPNVNVIKADGMRYGFADFKSAGLVVETKDLPESLWLKSDEAQFKWLDNVIGGRPEGMTWHHTEVPGKMELVPFGIHNITIHNGGRSTRMWADAPR